MTQLPEGVFSVFSAGPRQTALDRLSNNDDNPNSVFTRTFAKELTQPGDNLVQVAQRTRRLVSEMAETVKHKQIPVYFDQMVDDVFLNGMAKGRPEARKPAEACRAAAEGRGAAAGAAVPRCRKTIPSTRRSRCSRATMAAGPWCSRSPIRRSGFPGGWAIAGDFRETGFIDTLDPRTRKRMPNPSIELAGRRAGRHHPGALCRYQWRDAGAVPDPVRSGSCADPRPAQDPRHDRDELAVVPRIQRAVGLLHASDVVSLRDPRSARRHRQRGAGQGAEDAALRSQGSQRRFRTTRSLI